MHKNARVALWLLLSAGCAADDRAAATREVEGGAQGGPSARDAAVDPDARVDAVMVATNPDASAVGCDLSGVWIARMTSESLALSLPQYANTWYYYEFRQQGTALEVTRHMDCGIEVRGTVNVTLAKETTAALRQHNDQTGRRGVVTTTERGTCAIEIERFWSVRGVDEARYTPSPRNTAESLEQLQQSLPLPSAAMAELGADWDGDGKPGIRWIVGGIASGERHTAQRDWTRFFSAPGYEPLAADDFRDDLQIRADFRNEEVVFEADRGLAQLSQPNAAAPHTLTLRFLGRTPQDARALAVLDADPHKTCLNVQAALPSVAGLR